MFRNMYFVIKYCNILSWLGVDPQLLSVFYPDIVVYCLISMGAQILTPIFTNLDLPADLKPNWEVHFKLI